MKKQRLVPVTLSACIMAMTAMSASRALEVDVNEIRTRRVDFINYRAEGKKADSRQEIEDIGKALARGDVTDRPVRFHMKYAIIHAISKDEPGKFSADIFSIDRDAKVGHIDVIRRITTAYLMTRYRYEREDARAISLFLSYYNAVHRGDLAYFGGKYKGVVMKHIDARTAGIATKYWEWPGATRMLIPLTEGAVEPDLLSDKQTIEEIRKDDRNIPDRREMADLRQRKLDSDRRELKEEKKELEREKEELEREKEETRKKQEQLDREKEEAKKIVEPDKREEKQEEIEKEKKRLDEKKKETEKKEEEVKKKEKAIQDSRKKIEKRERSLSDEKRQIEKDELKSDIRKKPEEAKKKLEEKEKELDEREDRLREEELDKNIYAGKLYYLKLKEYLEGGHYNNDLYMINASTRKIMFKSPVENICGSRYDVYSGGIVIITHRGSHTSGHRLTLVDKDTLVAKTYGTDSVFWRSFIEIRDGYIYAILYDGGKCHLGRFDGSLKLTAKSKDELSENTFISFWDNYIYINRKDKMIIVLDKDDLSFIDEVKP